VNDHAMVYTAENEDEEPPPLLEGEDLAKQPLRMQPSGDEILHHTSRINFGKSYTVEHNVRVRGIGKIVKEHRAMLKAYWQSAHE
jgi:hypothetical protein